MLADRTRTDAWMVQFRTAIRVAVNAPDNVPPSVAGADYYTPV